MCKTFRCLPNPGGLLQQDPYHIEGMQMVIDAINEKEQADAKKANKKGK